LRKFARGRHPAPDVLNLVGTVAARPRSSRRPGRHESHWERHILPDEKPWLEFLIKRYVNCYLGTSTVISKLGIASQKQPGYSVCLPALRHRGRGTGKTASGNRGGMARFRIVNAATSGRRHAPASPLLAAPPRQPSTSTSRTSKRPAGPNPAGVPKQGEEV
jgi:hypothetical protein